MKNGDYSLVVAPEWYKGKRYRGKYCYEHHLVWERQTGCPVPDGCIIHHKDGNKYNNDITNLQLMSAVDHVRMHSTKGRVFLRLKCPSCGKIFEREKRACGSGRKLLFCSRQCIGKMYNFRAPTDAGFNKARNENIIEEFILG